ncbi:YjbH domain-containing protein [Xylophilus rhododendri]|uniref:YjbH domain-containing protein n=1 Tax=Xylophilus rhododendri TaxID=2697032 RepID=A0A857J7Z6_9BURK|nr:YjbH domain-containing protein [Xylophilus rhododendri]QHJ00171.1 YjbH domain-containing protein [Xylophilus rhododendri]
MSRLHSFFAPSAVGLACRCAIALGCAATLATPALAATDTAEIVPGERLSAWLQRQRTGQNSYPIGLQWYVPEEKPDQHALKDRITRQLSALRADKAPTGISLSRWVGALPVTGRAVVGNPDDRWLQANPDQDPVLQPGQRVKLPPRPTTATVVLDDGALCQVPYRAGVMALDYLRACVEDPDQRDIVWIAQPDGRTFRYGAGTWNAQAQNPPAAGAWIWAPARSSGLPDGFSDDLIQLLATQGLAADGAGRPVGAPPESERSISASRQRDLPLTASDWGEIGLLQTPTARMAPAGETRFTYSHIQPYTRATVMLQPLDWLEGGFRYSQVSNQLYDPSLVISSQSYKDKSVDAKVRLWKESRWIPELAIGARDLGGTGLFSGEYFVANKRTGDLDWSLGLGWGYLGARGNLRNPFGLISEQFDTRPGSTTTGTTNNKAYFRGPTSLFGGVQWQTPIKPLILKLEYDGNAYEREPFNNPIKQRLPVNAGAVYRYSEAVDLTAGIERGNRAMFGVTFHGGLDTLAQPKLLDPPTPAVTDRMPAGDPAWSRTAADIEAQTGWAVDAISRRGDTLLVRLSFPRAAYLQARLDRMTAVLHRDAPASIRRFSIEFSEYGMRMGGKSIRRADWVALHTQGLSPAQRSEHNIAFSNAPLGAPTAVQDRDGQMLWTSDNGRLRGGLSPSLWQSLGGPDSFLLYQIGVQGAAEYRVTSNTWLTGGVNMRLLDNYDKFKYTAPSDLPRVRTQVREYVTTSRFTVSNLQLTHAEQWGENHFVMAYGGLLESMYGGLGGEYMYRRRASPLAFGVDVNRVRQRGFDQRFDFREYEVNTGHATVYWETGWNDLQVNLSVGQYLARDRGATLEISRRFANGVSIGAYATKTNVSSAQFGEGSFDKGIFVSFPFDAILPKSSSANGTILWQPLLRDGGAKLSRSQTLYGLTNTRSPRAFDYRPAQPAD